MALFEEIYQSRRSVRDGENHWVAERRFAVLNYAASAFENTLWDSRHIGYGGEYAPRCRKVRVQRNWQPGLSLVTAFYKTVREPGRARIRMSTKNLTRKVHYDTEGTLIDGKVAPDDEADQSFMKVVRGSNVVPQARGVLVVETAFESTEDPVSILNGILSRTNHINSHDMSNLGAAKGTLRLLGAPDMSHVWEEDELWYVNYAFEYAPEGWNNITKTQKFEPRAIQVPVFSPDGEQVTGEWREILTDVAVENEKDTVMWPKASFSDLQALVRW